MRSIQILEPGPLATVQDRGRFGYRSWGVPVSGAMDLQAFRVGNLLVGNPQDSAGIEITAGGFRAEFRCRAHFAVCGQEPGIFLNGRRVESWRSHAAGEGDVLHVDAAGGPRTCFCVSGGIDVAPVMDSRSTYLRGRFGGLDGRPLRAGDILPVGPGGGWTGTAPAELVPRYSREAVLRAVPGPQDDFVSPESRTDFFSKWYEVSARADRMGLALSGPALSLPRGADIISDGTCPGAVQVHGNGQPTILASDCQTVGGYVKIATVISADLPLVAQLAPGDRVRFERTDLWQAREIYLRNEYLIRTLLP